MCLMRFVVFHVSFLGVFACVDRRRRRSAESATEMRTAGATGCEYIMLFNTGLF